MFLGDLAAKSARIMRSLKEAILAEYHFPQDIFMKQFNMIGK